MKPREDRACFSAALFAAKAEATALVRRAELDAAVRRDPADRAADAVALAENDRWLNLCESLAAKIRAIRPTTPAGLATQAEIALRWLFRRVFWRRTGATSITINPPLWTSWISPKGSPGSCTHCRLRPPHNACARSCIYWLLAFAPRAKLSSQGRVQANGRSLMTLQPSSDRRDRRADDLVERLESVKADAEARGFTTLAYFIETALIEGRLQVRCAADDKAPRIIRPAARWPRRPKR